MCKGLFDPDLEPGGLTTVDSSVTVVIGGGACVRELLFSDHRLFPRWVLAGMPFRSNGRLRSAPASVLVISHLGSA